MGGPDFSKKEMQRVLRVGFKNYFVKISKNHYELNSKKGICPYLKKDNSCLIHKIKPLMCICWPVCVDLINGKKKLYLAYCPMTKLLSKKEISKCKKEARKMPNAMLEESFHISKLPKSDLRLIRKRFNKFKKIRIR
jgi:Fe-S-cluster containining protein